jgi:nicotinamide mononucleotide transporter
MTWSEALGFLTGAICVWLCVKENIWNWPTGIANNIFYVIVFLHTGLYGDAGLQFVYIAIAIYGWWNWLHGGAERSELRVRRASAGALIGYAALTGVATAALFSLLHRYTNSTVPLSDAVTTALSLTAQYMMTRKILENWWFWITADVIYIVLYVYKGLLLTAVLYAIFLAMCIAGIKRWRLGLHQSKPMEAVAGS